MPILNNSEGDICWNLDLIRDEIIDINTTDTETQNSIPFYFSLNVRDKMYEFQENKTYFHADEINVITKGLNNIIHIIKEENDESLTKERFEPFYYICDRSLFEFKVYDGGKDQVEIELWLNSKYVTKFVHDNGITFHVDIDELEEFSNTLMKQYQELLQRKEKVVN